ncbi:MAG: hypothetical protein AAGF89_15660, partial [Bacteroidota bacterium]
MLHYTRLLLLYCLCLFCVVNLFALSNSKQGQIDSLKQLVKARTSLDETKVDLLNQLGYEHWITDPAKSIDYGI